MPAGTSASSRRHSRHNINARDDGDTPAWYSVNVGHIHIVALTVETDFTNTSIQHAWLAKDLATVNRSHTPWVVVVLHRQVFTGGVFGGTLADRMQRDLEPLLLHGKADLVVSGHVHSYLRVCAQKHGKCVNTTAGESAPAYVVDGTAGAFTGVSTNGEGYSCSLPQPPFSHPGIAARDCMWGWSRIRANRTHLRWQHRRWLTGDIVDELIITA